MNIRAEFKRYNELSSGLRAARRAGTEVVAELIDELEVLHMHCDSQAVKASCERLLREFRDSASATVSAHG